MRCSNCTVSALSNRLRHHGVSNNSRAADGNQRAVDLGPGVVDLARAQARDQRAEIKLHEGQHHQHHAGDLQPRRSTERRPLRPAGAASRRSPAKIRSASTRCVARRYCETSTRSRKARRHHPPADRALQRAETEDQPQPPPQIRGQHAAPHEPEKRQQIGDADHAPEQPVAPFPPENRLELGKRHAGVDFAILRDGLVGLERLRPLRLVERRQHAGDRLPLDDRKPGFGQPRGAADQHHQRDQRGDRDQPPSDGADLRGLLCGQ